MVYTGMGLIGIFYVVAEKVNIFMGIISFMVSIILQGNEVALGGSYYKLRKLCQLSA